MKPRVDMASGRVIPARQVASPNWDQRPAGTEPDLIVLHGISLPPGQYGGPWIDALFTNTLDPQADPYFAEIFEMRVSSHLLIRRDGELVQYVPLHGRAWHAGVSCFRGRERCNDFSIGIELEGDDAGPYTAAQYDTLLPLLEALVDVYPGLHRERITGHEHIAPGRKTDPGPGFDWSRLTLALGVALPACTFVDESGN